MKNFIFKSTDADLQKMFQYLGTIQKNVLYLTHQVDFIRKKVIQMDTDSTLQDQAHDYFQQKRIDEQHIDDIAEDND